MTKSDIREQLERRFRRLLEDYGIPEPDRVEHQEDELSFVWEDRKVILTIRISDFEENDAHGAYTREGLAA